VNHVIVGQDLCTQLQSLLGLPNNLLSFELRVAVNEIVTVKCEYMPEHVEGIGAVFEQYELVRRAAGGYIAPPPHPSAAIGFDAWMRKRTDAAHAAYMAHHAAGGIDYPATLPMSFNGSAYMRRANTRKHTLEEVCKWFGVAIPEKATVAARAESRIAQSGTEF
jgi:hypothetical protein